MGYNSLSIPDSVYQGLQELKARIDSSHIFGWNPTMGKMIEFLIHSFEFLEAKLNDSIDNNPNDNKVEITKTEIMELYRFKPSSVGAHKRGPARNAPLERRQFVEQHLRQQLGFDPSKEMIDAYLNDAARRVQGIRE